MKITDDGVTANIIRRFTLEDGPVHKMIHSIAGRSYQVQTVTIEYQLAASGNWTPLSARNVKLGGPILKKDGTPSQQWTDSHPDYIWRQSFQLLPEYQWVNDLIEKARPSGRPSIPAVEA